MSMRIHSIAILTSLLVSGSALAADRVERPIRATTDASLAERIVIDIPASSLVIGTHEEKTVSADGLAVRTYRGDRNRGEAESLLDEARVTMTRRGRTLYIERDLGYGDRFWNSPSATQFELSIQIPKGYPVEIDQRAGQIILEGEFGDLDVKLGAGDLELIMPEDLLGELDAATTIGELHTDLGSRVLEKSGVMAGSTSFVNPEGSSRVRLRVRAGALSVKLTE